MFFVNFSGDVLIDFHGFQVNNLQLKKNKVRESGCLTLASSLLDEELSLLLSLPEELSSSTT